MSFGIASAPYGAGNAAADKLVITAGGDIIVQGTLSTRVTRVAVTNGVAGGPAGTPAELSNLTSSYFSLAPTAANNTYLVPGASANPGLMLIIKNNAAIPAVLSSAGGSFVDGGSITPTFTLDPANDMRAITIIQTDAHGRSLL